jgi:Asp-tRNA(Asn)/Glu-tRNA(Gln) amidotransferase A subunit family amidase
MPQTLNREQCPVGGALARAASPTLSATSPFSLTGMAALSMRFGTSHDGLPIGVQIVSSWLAESTVLKVASLLEEVSPVRNPYPDDAGPVGGDQGR